VWALHHLQAGDIWHENEILKTLNEIKTHGFHGDVVESLNVHEAIKLGSGARDLYIENYIKSLSHLGNAGVKVVCYNFMPVFDWTRSDLYKKMKDGSTALFFERAAISNISGDELIKKISHDSKGFSLPGWEPERLKNIETHLASYRGFTTEHLYQNLRYFLEAILPEAERWGIKMAIHPDDPPLPVFGLPRIYTDKKAIRRILGLADSPSHTLTLCTGSLGANPKNDVVELIGEFASKISFVHIRNIKIFKNGDFIECSHRTCDGSVDICGAIKALMYAQFRGYIRPDHGRHIWNEKCRPGYGLYDRALGIMYIWGIYDTLSSFGTRGYS
jgi:mannonate dehydratase